MLLLRKEDILKKINLSKETIKQNLIELIGLFSFAVLSTYLCRDIPSFRPILVLFLGLSVAHQLFKTNTFLKNALILTLILALVVLSEKDYLTLVIVALILNSVYTSHTQFKTIALSVAPLMLFLEIIGFWGVPFYNWLIWFWGFPVVILAFLVVGMLRLKNAVPFFSALLSVAVIFNQIILYSQSSDINLVQSEPNSKIEGVSENLLSNISDKAKLIEYKVSKEIIDVGGDRNKWLIIAPAVPALNDVYLKSKIKRGEYWFFGEHDNLEDFVQSGSIFNIDDFQRKAPWHVYRPIMSRTLERASNQDPIFASNIGCTLRHTIFGYPLIWEYSALGIPNLIALGEFHGAWRMTYVGDSDPVVKFLCSYNPHFLRALLNYPDFTDLLKGLLLGLCIYVNSTHRRKKLKEELAFSLMGLCGLFIAYIGPNYKNIALSPVDVSITYYGTFLSPHYESHSFSLPKYLSQENLTVVINDPYRSAKLCLFVVDNRNVEISEKDDLQESRRIVLITPNSSIRFKNSILKVEDIPLGGVERVVFDRTIKIPDARRIILDGEVRDCTVSLGNSTVLIASNSPQLIKGIENLR